MAKKIIHKAGSRGHANHGWLDSHHTFSFANYYDPDRMNFGVLRVLNDDIIKGGTGFGTHPHDNMEIISIPIRGSLKHKDSMGHVQELKENEVQVMSAGSGITHSEFNGSQTNESNFLQIWIVPLKRNVTPRYDQKQFDPADRKNKLQQVVSPEQIGDGLWINQDAWFSWGDFEKGNSADYVLHKQSHGVYVFVIEGEVLVEKEKLGKRDAIGITESDSVKIEALEDSRILLMEVPMEF